MLFLTLLVVLIHADVVRGDEPIYRTPDEHQNQNVLVNRAPDDGKSDANNDTCVKDSDCPWRFSSCQNEVCTCNDGYEFVGDECRPAKDKNQQIQNIPPKDGCVFDSQCPIENSICENKQCFCADGYELIGNKCDRNDQTSRSARFASDFVTHLGRPCENDYHCDERQFLNCDPNSKRCVCALGYNPTDQGCIFTGFPGQRETPGQYSGKVHVNSNPTQNEHSISLPRGKDGNYRLTYAEKYPANPEGFYSGAYGHSCGSSADCKLHYLFCNPVRNICECSKGFLYEYGNCVREVSLDIKPGYSTVKKSGTTSLYATYGGSCYANADCYSDALVCHVYTYQCVCSPRARLDGQYCVIEESFQTPTEYYKADQPTVTQQYNPGPNYPNPPPIVTGPNQHQNPGPYNPGLAPPYSPTRSHPVPPTNYNPNPNYNINYRQTPFRPYVDNRQHERRSVGTGKKYCAENNQCRGEFTYCNEDSNRCECVKGYVEANGLCVEENGIYCVTNANCQFQYTYCRNNKCTCISGYQRVGGHCVDTRMRDLTSYCNREEDCARLPYSRCSAGRCQCADQFSLVNGFCRPKQEKLDTYCDRYHPCDARNTECDTRSNVCVCAEGYARYRQTCQPTGSLHGWCTVHGTCTSPDLACDRRNFQCECAFGSIGDWSCQ